MLKYFTAPDINSTNVTGEANFYQFLAALFSENIKKAFANKKSFN